MRTESFDQYNPGDTGRTMTTTQWRADDSGQMVVVGEPDAITGPRSLLLRKSLGEGNARLVLDFPDGGNMGYVAFSMRAPTFANVPNQSVGFWFENGSISMRSSGSSWLVVAQSFIGLDDWQSEALFIDEADFGPGMVRGSFDGTLCLDLSKDMIDVCVLGNDGSLIASKAALGAEFYGPDWLNSFGSIVGVFVGDENKIVSVPRPATERAVIDNIVCDIGNDLETVPYGCVAVNLLPTAPETVTAEIYSQNGDYTFGWEIMARTGPGPNDMVRAATVDQRGAWAIAARPDLSLLNIELATIITRANATDGEAIWPFIATAELTEGTYRTVQTFGTFIYNPMTTNPYGQPWGTVEDFISLNASIGFNLPA